MLEFKKSRSSGIMS